MLEREPICDDADLHSELAHLKHLVSLEITKNHALEDNLSRLDLKITLLIANKGITHYMAERRIEALLVRLAAASDKKKKKGQEQAQKYQLSAKKVETYDDLFYMLQTESVDFYPERQKKEIQRLTTTLNTLKKNSQFISEQIAEYEKYLENALKKQYEGKKKKQLLKPKKFDYAELEKIKVIGDSGLTLEQKKKAKFSFSAPEPGIFEMVCKYDKQSIERYQIKLDELLEKNFNQIERLELPNLSLNDNELLYLLNKKIHT